MKLVRSLFLVVVSIFGMVACGPATLPRPTATPLLIDGKIEALKVSQGLKEALRIGAKKAKEDLSAPDSYLNSRYQIKLPKEIIDVTNRVEKIEDYKNVKEELIKKFNTTAEITTKEAAAVFIKAINDLSFPDAEKILKGKHNAATTFLEQAKGQQLRQYIKPLIQKSLTQSRTTAAWEKVLIINGKIPFPEKVSIDISEFLTKETVKNTLAIIAQEEAIIRTDKTARSSSLLQKVFALQDVTSTAGRD